MYSTKVTQTTRPDKTLIKRKFSKLVREIAKEVSKQQLARVQRAENIDGGNLSPGYAESTTKRYKKQGPLDLKKTGALRRSARKTGGGIKGGWYQSTGKNAAKVAGHHAHPSKSRHYWGIGDGSKPTHKSIHKAITEAINKALTP